MDYLEKITLKKKFFLKAFIVSVVLLIIACIITMMGFDFFASLAEKMMHLTRGEYILLTGAFYTGWKLLIIQFTLVPFIAAMLLEKHYKNDDTPACKL